MTLEEQFTGDDAAAAAFGRWVAAQIEAKDAPVTAADLALFRIAFDAGFDHGINR